MDSVSQSSQSFKRADLVLFAVQVVLIFIVVCVSLINLTFEWGKSDLWTVLLTSLLGYIMPNPKLKLMNSSIEDDKKPNLAREFINHE